MEWANAAVAYQKEKYPDMYLVADFVESNEDHDTAYTKTQELLKTYPDLVGIIGCSVIDPAGAALAVEEAGKIGQVKVIGTSVADVAGAYLESGAISMYSSWDTDAASYAMCEAARIVKEGGEVKTGDDLGAEGYESVVVEGHVIYGQAWMDFTVDNMSEDPYLCLLYTSRSPIIRKSRCGPCARRCRSSSRTPTAAWTRARPCLTSSPRPCACTA